MSVTGNGVNFKGLEQEIFRFVCGLGCELLKNALESYDRTLTENRDFKMYRNKGLRKSVMKTVMGEVEYRRTMYETIGEDGTKHYVYLL